MSDNEKSMRYHELLQEYRDLLTHWRGLRYGRVKCISLLSERTDRKVTEHAMRKALKTIDKQISLPKIVALETDDDADQSIEELIRDRIHAHKRKKKKDSKHRRRIEMPAESFGILVFGDPHIDNDGCSMDLLVEHVKFAQETPGVYAATVGDIQDNWIGRLGRLYANSSVTASDGWRLSEWLLSSMQWLAIVGGNHDSWAHGPGVDPLAWLSRRCKVLCYAPDELLITFCWKERPDLEDLIVKIRHDAPGRSWFHPTHGPNKELMLDGKCHVMIAGHIHQWGVLTTEQRHGRVSHAVRVKGYKNVDAFAVQKGFSKQYFGEAAMIIVQPNISGPGRVQVMWNIKKACEYLTFLRSNHG